MDPSRYSALVAVLVSTADRGVCGWVGGCVCACARVRVCVCVCTACQWLIWSQCLELRTWDTIQTIWIWWENLTELEGRRIPLSIVKWDIIPLFFFVLLTSPLVGKLIVIHFQEQPCPLLDTLNGSKFHSTYSHIMSPSAAHHVLKDAHRCCHLAPSPLVEPPPRVLFIFFILMAHRWKRVLLWKGKL